ncbi:MAG: hypothetical protein AB7V32_02295, partial [Candidatus Berkiella sp.]
SWLAHRQVIPQEKQKAFFEELATQYIDITEQTDNIIYHYATWEFLARKSSMWHFFYQLKNLIHI